MKKILYSIIFGISACFITWIVNNLFLDLDTGVKKGRYSRPAGSDFNNNYINV